MCLTNAPNLVADTKGAKATAASVREFYLLKIHVSKWKIMWLCLVSLLLTVPY
jgi:hypothetical protein